LGVETGRRKADHIRIALNHDVQARRVTTGFEDVGLVHCALPETDREKIDLSTTVFGHRFAAPLMVGAITGGTHEAAKINAAIAETVQDLGLGMGVGSQRAALENKKLEETFSIVRKKAPTAFLVANIGGIQLVNGYGSREVKKAVQMIEADAIAIHLNALQETAQPEGQTNFSGILEKIAEIAEEIERPVIAKETGAGIAAEEAKKLAAAGVNAIDVSGAGGTSFAAVEHLRAKTGENDRQRRMGRIFWDWGIPTAVSIVEVYQSVKLPVIASGGIRSGLNAAEALALGSSLASLSQPMLRAAVTGVKETHTTLSLLVDELRNAMFLTGAKTVKDLHLTPVVITGRVSEWLKTRGFDVETYAQRTRN
jgi:isopentenyl-diphosphate delta-isomerase